MLKATLRIVTLTVLLSPLAYAEDNKTVNEAHSFLKSVFADNAKHIEEMTHEDFKSFSEQQNPRATVLTCSDSRIQTDAYHKSPVNDLFFIRNIGNQIKTTEGSIEYGVEHLHTPILFIIGHSQCGAIKTALGNYSSLSKPIRTELDHLHLTPKISTDEGVVENIHNQVKYAISKYKDKIKNKNLVVVGAVYDFRDDFKHGHGKLILLNINGERDPIKLKNNPYIEGIENIHIGIEN